MTALTAQQESRRTDLLASLASLGFRRVKVEHLVKAGRSVSWRTKRHTGDGSWWESRTGTVLDVLKRDRDSEVRVVAVTDHPNAGTGVVVIPRIGLVTNVRRAGESS